jgi:hypothetical protein
MSALASGKPKPTDHSSPTSTSSLPPSGNHQTSLSDGFPGTPMSMATNKPTCSQSKVRGRVSRHQSPPLPRVASAALAPPTQLFPGLIAAHMQKRSPRRPRPATASGPALSPVDLPPTSTTNFSTPQDQEPHKHRNVSMGLPTAWIGSPQALPVWPASPSLPATPPFLRSDLDPRVATLHTSHSLTSISISHSWTLHASLTPPCRVPFTPDTSRGYEYFPL